uniref:Uncharacterized protein n=1 Tax=Arundo donax TaxID=35708 RepID=A0A0A9C9G2_ARUDO
MSLLALPSTSSMPFTIFSSSSPMQLGASLFLLPIFAISQHKRRIDQ